MPPTVRLAAEEPAGWPSPLVCPLERLQGGCDIYASSLCVAEGVVTRYRAFRPRGTGLLTFENSERLDYGKPDGGKRGERRAWRQGATDLDGPSCSRSPPPNWSTGSTTAARPSSSTTSHEGVGRATLSDHSPGTRRKVIPNPFTSRYFWYFVARSNGLSTMRWKMSRPRPSRIFHPVLVVIERS
jgi:hypothetical protein